MILYFDFNANKTKFIQQQNKHNCFAVDFLMSKSQKKDFEGIIEEICSKNKQILQILQSEKNFVVLPDDVLGFDNLEVPTIKFVQKNKFFKTKFDILYNKKQNMMVLEDLFFKDKNKSIFTFALLQKDIVKSIIKTFKKYNVAISGISYFSFVVKEFLIDTQKGFAKTNSLVVFNDANIDVFAFCQAKTIGAKKIVFLKNKNNFAKKYAIFAKNKENLSKFFDKNIEKKIAKTKIEKSGSDLSITKANWLIEDFAKSFEHSNLAVKFEKVYFFGKKSEDLFENLEICELDNVSIEQILMHYKQSPLFFAKRSFWK